MCRGAGAINTNTQLPHLYAPLTCKRKSCSETVHVKQYAGHATLPRLHPAKKRLRLAKLVNF